MDELLATVLQAVLGRSGVDPLLVGDIIVGNVLQMGSGAVSSRMAQLYAGIPYHVPLSAVNRQCSSGLEVTFTTARMRFTQKLGHLNQIVTILGWGILEIGNCICSWPDQSWCV